LQVSEITAEGAKLSWNPPSDDGGQPIENYVVEKLDEATGRWVPAGETTGPQTNLKIEGLTPGHKYKFRVRAQNKQGKSEPLATDKYIEAKNPFGKSIFSCVSRLLSNLLCMLVYIYVRVSSHKLVHDVRVIVFTVSDNSLCQ